MSKLSELNIVKFGDPILRKKCRPVDTINDRILTLLDDMTSTLYAAPGRAGLAAPQVGIARKVVVIDCGDGLIELINPEIIEKSGEQIGGEACLSLPGVHGIVKRYEQVTVKTLTRSGEEKLIEAEGFLAKCLQHEVEHLDGILFIDHVAPGQLFDDKTKEPVDLFAVLKLSKPEN